MSPDQLLGAALAVATILALLGVVARQREQITLLREMLRVERERRARASSVAARWARHPETGRSFLSDGDRP